MGRAILVAIVLGVAAVLLIESGSGVASGDGNASGSFGGVVIATPLNAKISQLASAIARAEGFGISGTVPTTAHNPGDLVLGDQGLGVANSAGVTIFPDDTTGWGALYHELNLIFSGESSVYSPGLSFGAFAQLWTGGDNPGGWATTVSQNVGASPGSLLSDWYNA